VLNQPRLTDACIPYQHPIYHGRDYHCVVYLVLVYKVQALDGVSENAKTSDGRSCAVDHMFVPFEVMGDINPKVFDQCGDGNIEAFGLGVSVTATPYLASSMVCVST